MRTTDAERMRKSELAQIHVAKKQLGLADDEYRAMLRNVCNVASSADLDWRGRKKLLDHLGARGWKKKSIQRGGRHPALIAKVRALLIHQGGLPDAYADGIAARMFGVGRFTWCEADQLRALIAALTKRGQKADAAHG